MTTIRRLLHIVDDTLVYLALPHKTLFLVYLEPALMQDDRLDRSGFERVGSLTHELIPGHPPEHTAWKLMSPFPFL